jgi:hypothetical protein
MLVHTILALQLFMILLRVERIWMASWLVVLLPIEVTIMTIAFVMLYMIWKFVHKVGSFVMTVLSILPLLATGIFLIGKWDGHWEQVSTTNVLAPTASIQMLLAVVQLVRLNRQQPQSTISSFSAL